MTKRFFFFASIFSIVCFIYGASSSGTDGKSSNSTFRAAVFEYRQYDSQATNDQSEAKRINLKSYAKAVQVASDLEANIIVFPESGIFSASNRLIASINYELIPQANESVTPCTDWSLLSNQITSSPSVYSLSCLSQIYNIYIAAILGEKVDCSPSVNPNCPEDGYYFYNTQVLFNSKGKLVAKYHKYHLFFETAHNIPSNPEIVTVETPFGKLGFLICFDILFNQPALSLIYDESVDTIIFGARWIGETPFLNAHQVQLGFAIEHNVNLLAAGINDLVHGALGSGIYVASEGPTIYTADITKSGSKLLIADIPKTKKTQNPQDKDYFIVKEDKFAKMIENIEPPHDQSIDSPFRPWTLELDLFNYTILSSQSGTILLCTEESVCCELNYHLSNPTFNSTYYLLVKRWMRPTTKICEEFCGLIAYDSNDYSIQSNDFFSHLQLTGTFSSNLSFPSVVTNNLQLISKLYWSYIHKDNVATITIDNLRQPLLGVTLYSRCEKDDQQIYP